METEMGSAFEPVAPGKGRGREKAWGRMRLGLQQSSKDFGQADGLYLPPN